MDKHTFWSWLAGLADGEGCFYLIHQRGVFTARFAIGLRCDDWQMLKMVADYASCGVFKRKLAQRGNEHPTIRWEVAAIDECIALIDGFESGVGLQSKKRRDYELWKEAVGLIDVHGGGAYSAAAERLLCLTQELHDVKEFSPLAADGYADFLGRGLDSHTDKSRTRTGRSSSIFWESEAGLKQKEWRAARYAKVTQAQVQEIVAKRAEGDTLRAIAKQYGISAQTVSNFVQGKYAKRS